jgi:hypothetical protein
MVHVVAGPTILRQLSAQGADALNLSTLNWVEEPPLYWQCDAGTRQAYMDTRVDENRKANYELAKGAGTLASCWSAAPPCRPSRPAASAAVDSALSESDATRTDAET